MSDSKCSRRNFVTSSLGVAAIAGFGAPMYIPSKVFGDQDGPSANNKINIGMVGLGLMACYHFGYFLGKRTEIVALCDVNKAQLVKPMDMINAANKKCDTYEHYEELIDRPDIDAIFICTPDHWHVRIAIDAMRKGKDVYVEKPISLTVEEGIAITHAEKKYGRIVQVGSQQRSDEAFRKAAELVRNGYIGEIIECETSLGEFPPEQQFAEEPIPSTLNYDKWLGPAPWAPYNKIRIEGNFGGGWRCFWDYGSRKHGDWGAHHHDIIQWALGMDESGPVKFIPKGLNGEPFQHHIYANGIKVYRERNTFRKGNMIGFKGTKGTVRVGRNIFETTPASLKYLALPASDVHLYKSTDHKGNWLDSILTRQSTICPASVGHRTNTIGCISAIAERLGRAIEWDPQKEAIIGDAGASKWLSRPHRAPYALNV